MSNEWVDAINTEREFINATDIEEGSHTTADGASVEGTLLAINESPSKFKDMKGEPKIRYSLHFRRADGSEFILNAAGTLAYNAKDGKLSVGSEYRIIRNGLKGDTSTTNFKVLTRVANAGNVKRAATKKEVAV